MALALKPRVLLLDEPTAGMGEQETYQVAGLIRRLHKNSDYTIVLIEHDMRVVFNLADRITVLDRGHACWRKARRRRSPTIRRCRPPIWGRPNERARGRGAEHLLRQEPHPARCRSDGRRGQDHDVARPQWRRQDHDAAEPDGPDAAARGQVRMFGQDITRLPPYRIAAMGVGYVPEGRRIFRQPDGGRQSARAAGAAGAVDHRAQSTSCSRAWRSASATWAASSPAASRRCCRSPAPCCSTHAC